MEAERGKGYVDEQAVRAVLARLLTEEQVTPEAVEDAVGYGRDLRPGSVIAGDPMVRAFTMEQVGLLEERGGDDSERPEVAAPESPVDVAMVLRWLLLNRRHGGQDGGIAESTGVGIDSARAALTWLQVQGLARVSIDGRWRPTRAAGAFASLFGLEVLAGLLERETGGATA
jgi:hypothetical protein